VKKEKEETMELGCGIDSVLLTITFPFIFRLRSHSNSHSYRTLFKLISFVCVSIERSDEGIEINPHSVTILEGHTSEVEFVNSISKQFNFLF
jgi:hypothetical protein